jgi:hypothetical protein
MPLGQAPPREFPHGGGPDLIWLVDKAVATDGNLPSGRQGSPIGAAGGHPRLPRLDSPIATSVPRAATYVRVSSSAQSGQHSGGEGRAREIAGGERAWGTVVEHN